MKVNLNSTKNEYESKYQQTHRKTYYLPYKNGLNNLDLDISDGSNQKSQSEKPKKWGGYLFLLILAPLILLIFLSTTVLNNQKQYNQSVQSCKSLLQEAKQQGLNIADLNCPENQISLTSFTKTIDYEPYFENQKVLKDREKTIQTEIDIVNQKIASTQNQLKLLQVNYSEKITEPQPNKNLAIYFENQKQYLENIGILLNESKTKINNSIQIYSTLISYGDKLQLQNQQQFLSQYTKSSEDEKIKGYQELIKKIEELQTLLEKSNPTEEVKDLLKFKFFTGAAFKDLYEQMAYKNVAQTSQNFNITGDVQADKHIVNLAEKRGYKKRKQAFESVLQSVDGEKLQSEAKQAWLDMKAAALNDGIKLGLVSGYRSVSVQQDLFKSRFEEASKKDNKQLYTPDEIVRGDADAVIDKVLQMSSVPNYSRHHTGFTIDIKDANDKNSFTQFKDTKGYEWIMRNNYLNAKKFGFIPSYPAGQNNVGPEPEEWEYVWVGKNLVEFKQ